MTPYTPSTGLTNQGQQLAAGMPNASNTQPPPNGGGDTIGQLGGGQELSPQQLSQVTGAYGNAANQLGNMQTSDARQGYVNNSNIPAMQQNYEDLARQLFQYDQGTLAPQFQGQNPGTPTDAASFGRVDASPLAMTMQAAGLPASQGLAMGNPKANYQAQISQGDNIANLLNTLNSGIGQEFSQRAGTYKNTVDKQATLLKSISDILDMNRQTSLTNKQIESENARAAMQMQNQQLLEQMRQKGDSERVKMQITGSTNPDELSLGSTQGLSERQATQQKYNSLPIGSPVRQKIATTWAKAHNNIPLFADDTTNAINSLKNIYSSWNQIGNILGFSGDKTHIDQYTGQRRVLADKLAKAFGLNRNGAQVQALLGLLPQVNDPRNVMGVNGKFVGILDGLLSNNGMALVKNKKGQMGLEFIDSIGPDEQEVDITDKNIGKILGK